MASRGPHQQDITWPKVYFLHYMYVFHPSPVCTDQQVENCSIRGQPMVRNTEPERFHNPDYKDVQQVAEEQPHLVASAVRCAGSAALTRAVDVGIQKWIADTGAGLHLIPRSAVRKRNLFSKCRKLNRSFVMHTANGSTDCDTILECRMDMLDAGYIGGHILDSTPPVISVGRLVEDCGYKFHWTPRTGPYFDAPSGRRIVCGVEDYVPFFITKDTERRSDCRRVPKSAVFTATPAPVNGGADDILSEPSQQQTDAQEWEQARADAGVSATRCDQPPSSPEGLPEPVFIKSFIGPNPTHDVGLTPVPTARSVTQFSQTQPFDIMQHLPDHNRNSSFPEHDRLAFEEVMRDPHPSESLLADVAQPAEAPEAPSPPANVDTPADPPPPVLFPANSPQNRSRQGRRLKIWRHVTDLDAMPNQFSHFPDGPPIDQVVARCVSDMRTGHPMGPKVYVNLNKEGFGPTSEKLLAGSGTYFPDNEPRRCQIMVWYDDGRQGEIVKAKKAAMDKPDPQFACPPCEGYAEFAWMRHAKGKEQDEVEEYANQWQGRKLKRSARWLKIQAKSLNHQLTHFPANRFCQTCRAAKAQKVPAKRRRFFKTPLAAFGDEVTVDHIIARNVLSHGLKGEKYGFVFRDRYTGWLDAAPINEKTANTAGAALVDIRGAQDTFKYFYTDGAPEIKKSLINVGPRGAPVAHDECVPGRHAPVIERTNRHVLEGTRALLRHAGTPYQFWPWAMRQFCFLENVAKYDGEPSSYEKRHGETFIPVWDGGEGPHLPYGAAIEYRPSPDNPAARPKIDPSQSPLVRGIFLGYKPVAGRKNPTQAYVCELRGNLSRMNMYTARKHPDKDGHSAPIRIDTVPAKSIIYPTEIHYPLQKRYAKAYSDIDDISAGDVAIAAREMEKQGLSPAESADDIPPEEEPAEPAAAEEPADDDEKEDEKKCDVCEARKQALEQDVNALDPVSNIASNPPPSPTTERYLQEFKIGPEYSKNFVFRAAQDHQPVEKGPTVRQIVARTTVLNETGEVLEWHAPMEHLQAKNRTMPLTYLDGKQIREPNQPKFITTILYFDPTIKRVRRVNFGYKWVTLKHGTRNPGVHPTVWSSISSEHQERIRMIFEAQQRGTFAKETATNKPDEDPSNWGSTAE